MKTFRAKLLFLLLAGSILLSACGSGTSENANSAANRVSNTNSNSNLTKDDAEEFSRIVTMPFPPEEVAWREISGGEKKKMIAVLKFSAADAQSLVAQAERHRPAAASEVGAEDWFPPELIAQSEQSGDSSLKGKGYAANDFILEPYKSGKLTRISDTDYFVLELSDQMPE